MLSVEQRLVNLERSARRWRTGCVLAFCGLAVVLCIGAGAARHDAEFDAISCHAIYILNGKGERVGAFQAGERWTMLAVGNPDAEYVTLSAAADGSESSLKFVKAGDHLRAAMGCTDQTASLYLGNLVTDKFPMMLFSGQTGGELALGSADDLRINLKNDDRGGGIGVRSADGHLTVVSGKGVVSREPERGPKADPSPGK